MDRRPVQTAPPETQSAFDASAATGIAQRAVRKSRRAQSTPPLVGQESNLLVALRQAELAHAQTLQAVRQEEANAQKAAPARRGRRPGVSQTGGRHHLAPLCAFITVLKAFWDSATGTRFGYEVERGAGVPGGVAPRSAAARLVWEAVQYLDQDYTLANIGTVSRAGKGTIARILTKLIGQRNTTSPSLGSLGSDFGLEPLIGKQLAIVSDMTLGKSTNTAILRENLMRISGEDMVSVNRKYKPVTDWRLPVRFLVLTNSLPRLQDASGAFANRFVPLPMTKSFLGNEDRSLDDRLSEELPGIMRWAIDGWRRLKSRGRFTLPRSSQELLEELRKVGAPITRFVEEECRMDAQAETPKAELYAHWKRWCERNGEYANSHGAFCQMLLDACNGQISTGKATLESGREPTFRGIEPREKVPF